MSSPPRWGLEGSINVTGTIQCTAGYDYQLNVVIRQKSGSKCFTAAGESESGTCSTTGSQTFVLPYFFANPPQDGPFRKGKAVSDAFVIVFDRDTLHETYAEEITEIRIR
jgi:hypothetical protein